MNWKELWELISENHILRRYLVMNSFDGTLSAFGLVIAMFLSKVSDPKLVLISGIGVVFATGISGVWSGYLSEKAERKHELLELKRLNPGENLESRKKEFGELTIIMGLANGMSTAIVGALVISPFFFAAAHFVPVQTAFLISFALVAVILVILGAVMSRISKESFWKHAFLTLLAGFMVGIIIFLFELLKF
ncbi:MAG: VIT1/CCC1 transporter family protein [Candidatus ainarchaeum sp.]|nr:VIT1/CCC1 transporter family protein [Candidatus ainarchaeum sp.]